MRTKEAIESDIKAQKEVLKQLKKELEERKFFDFCEKYGVKAGDIVEVEHYQKLQIIKTDWNWNEFILCRVLFHDNKPTRNVISVKDEVFDGCKVVGHKKIEL